MVAKPSSSSAVAGAGTGSQPCAVSTRPAPSGSGAQLQLAGTVAVVLGGDQHRGGDDVGDRIDGADLVERHRLRRDAVHPRLGRGQFAEDAERMVLHRRLQRCRQQPRADVAPARVRVAVLRGIDHEARAGQRVVVMAQHAAGHLCDRRDRAPARRSCSGAASSSAATNMSPATPPSGSRCRCRMPPAT